MFSLFKKDFFNLLGSTVSLVVLGIYLILVSLFLWVIPGEYNLIDGGLAVTDSLFRLSSLLFLVLIPALTMRSFAEERRQGTWDLLCVRPISNSSLFWAKFGAVTVVLTLAILITCVHILFLSHYTLVGSSIDTGVVLTSYTGLALWVAACVSMGLYASSVTSNQVVAFVLALLINLFFNYGFELLSIIPGFTFLQTISDTLSLTARYKSMQRGVIDTRDILYFLSLIFAFALLTSSRLSGRLNRKHLFIAISTWILILFISINWFVRFDFTTEKRYTLSSLTQSIVTQINQPVHVNIYLDGELNAGFSRLKNGVGELIDECNVYSSSPIYYQYINPSQSPSKEKREKVYAYLISKGMKPISVNETDREGKVTQKVVFPWAEIISGNDTIRFSLLKTLPGKSGQENLNVSLESLELKWTEKLQHLIQKHPVAIAFLEGHDELPEPYVADAMNRLSNSYKIDRGVVGNDPKILSPYSVLVIAAPQKAFSESDKYVLDQYLMHGGRIFWLVDGAIVPLSELAQKSETTAAPLDLNLSDLFFCYGVRVNPVLLQDKQCLSIPFSNPDNPSEVYPAPWIFAPVLSTDVNHLVSKYISPVKSEFVSSIDIVGENKMIRKTVLLRTSSHTHELNLPQTVSYQSVFQKYPSNYFNSKEIPVAVLLEGKFSSLFKNRFLPEGVSNAQIVTESQPTRMIIAASGSLIKNEIHKSKTGEISPVSLGYEPYSDMQYGNPEFIVNAVQYLAGDEAKIALQSKQFVLRLLDHVRLTEQLTLVQSLTIFIPILLLCLLVGGVFLWRRKRYGLIRNGFVRN